MQKPHMRVFKDSITWVGIGTTYILPSLQNRDAAENQILRLLPPAVGCSAGAADSGRLSTSELSARHNLPSFTETRISSDQFSWEAWHLRLAVTFTFHFGAFFILKLLFYGFDWFSLIHNSFHRLTDNVLSSF